MANTKLHDVTYLQVNDKERGYAIDSVITSKETVEAMKKDENVVAMKNNLCEDFSTLENKELQEKSGDLFLATLNHMESDLGGELNLTSPNTVFSIMREKILKATENEKGTLTYTENSEALSFTDLEMAYIGALGGLSMSTVHGGSTGSLYEIQDMLESTNNALGTQITAATAEVKIEDGKENEEKMNQVKALKSLTIIKDKTENEEKIVSENTYNKSSEGPLSAFGWNMGEFTFLITDSVGQGLLKSMELSKENVSDNIQKKIKNLLKNSFTKAQMENILVGFMDTLFAGVDGNQLFIEGNKVLSLGADMKNKINTILSATMGTDDISHSRGLFDEDGSLIDNADISLLKSTAPTLFSLLAKAKEISSALEENMTRLLVQEFDGGQKSEMLQDDEISKKYQRAFSFFNNYANVKAIFEGTEDVSSHKGKVIKELTKPSYHQMVALNEKFSGIKEIGNTLASVEGNTGKAFVVADIIAEKGEGAFKIIKAISKISGAEGITENSLMERITNSSIGQALWGLLEAFGLTKNRGIGTFDEFKASVEIKSLIKGYEKNEKDDKEMSHTDKWKKNNDFHDIAFGDKKPYLYQSGDGAIYKENNAGKWEREVKTLKDGEVAPVYYGEKEYNSYAEMIFSDLSLDSLVSVVNDKVTGDVSDLQGFCIASLGEKVEVKDKGKGTEDGNVESIIKSYSKKQLAKIMKSDKATAMTSEKEIVRAILEPLYKQKKGVATPAVAIEKNE